MQEQLAVERALRAVDVTLKLLEEEARLLRHAIRQADVDIATNEALSQEADARAGIAQQATVFLSRVVQTPYMQAVDKATASAVAKELADGNAHAHGPHGVHCRCHMK